MSSHEGEVHLVPQDSDLEIQFAGPLSVQASVSVPEIQNVMIKAYQ